MTLTTWASLGLAAAAAADDDAAGYTARDVFTQAMLPVNASGFVANVTGFNATLVLVQRAA